MMSLFFRNLLYTTLQPGMVAGVIPYWLTGKNAKTTFAAPFVVYHFLGMLTFAIGFVLMLICIISFAIQGKGTLSPADPTRKLVIAGLYRFSRNPMYIGVMMMLIGESFFFQSNVLGAYSLLIFIAFNIFIIYFEEPRLRKDFADDYDIYVKQVRRWF